MTTAEYIPTPNLEASSNDIFLSECVNQIKINTRANLQIEDKCVP